MPPKCASSLSQTTAQPQAAALCTPQGCLCLPPGVTPFAIDMPRTTVSTHNTPLNGASLQLTAKESQELQPQSHSCGTRGWPSRSRERAGGRGEGRDC